MEEKCSHADNNLFDCRGDLIWFEALSRGCGWIVPSVGLVCVSLQKLLYYFLWDRKWKWAQNRETLTCTTVLNKFRPRKLSPYTWKFDFPCMLLTSWHHSIPKGLDINNVPDFFVTMNPVIHCVWVHLTYCMNLVNQMTDWDSSHCCHVAANVCSHDQKVKIYKRQSKNLMLTPCRSRYIAICGRRSI